MKINFYNAWKVVLLKVALINYKNCLKNSLFKIKIPLELFLKKLKKLLKIHSY